MPSNTHPAHSKAVTPNQMAALAALAAQFTAATRVTATDIDHASGAWNLHFNNGCKLIVDLEGNAKLICPVPEARS